MPAYPLTVPSTSFDERVSSWVLRGQTSNIQVTGRFAGPVEGTGEGSNGFGFLVSAQPSRLEIVVVEGIPVLRDGYHRAVGLHALGITVVPALLAPAGISAIVGEGFELATAIGEHGPRLIDFLDDRVSGAVSITRTKRVLILQALDIELPL